MAIDNKLDFTGPVFIVGMPRSGTKLLRDLLNQHSQIGIPDNESHFIPRYYKRIDEFGDLHDRDNFSLLYKELYKTNFFRRLEKKDLLPNQESWMEAVEDWSYKGVVEAFFSLQSRMRGKAIWGDKTPSYLAHVDMLVEMYPKAKFVHIIRDPRDYCLSVKKAWGKNIYRAAVRWREDVGKCRLDGEKVGLKQYFELTYEGLLDETSQNLIGICTFLGIDFESSMLNLERPSENLGDAKGQTAVVSGNYGKWKDSFSQRQVEKIEAICGNLMSEVGYEAVYQGGEFHPSESTMLYYKFLDGFSLLRYNYKQEGGAAGVLRWFSRVIHLKLLNKRT